MPIVCINRPNRKNPRYFTAKDVKRIAKYAQQDGANPFEIFAGVGFSLGLGYLFCIAARTIDNMASLNRLILKIAGITALGRFVDFVLTVLSSGAYKKLAKVKRIGLVLVIVAAITEPILKGAKSLIEDAELMVSASELVHDLCSRVRELAEEAGDVIDDKYSDLKDFID